MLISRVQASCWILSNSRTDLSSESRSSMMRLWECVRPKCVSGVGEMESSFYCIDCKKTVEISMTSQMECDHFLYPSSAHEYQTPLELPKEWIERPVCEFWECNELVNDKSMELE